jgi:hypothetical protein
MGRALFLLLLAVYQAAQPAATPPDTEIFLAPFSPSAAPTNSSSA